MRRALLTFIALAFFSACTQISGSITVEGQDSQLQTCNSLEPLGFDGVDLEMTNGTTIRLFREDERITAVGFFESPENETGFLVGDCASGEISDQNSMTNRITDLTGNVRFNCVDPLQIEGAAEFSNCH